MTKQDYIAKLSKFTGADVQDSKVSIYESFAKVNEEGRFDMKFTQKMVLFILGVLLDLVSEKEAVNEPETVKEAEKPTPSAPKKISQTAKTK